MPNKAHAEHNKKVCEHLLTSTLYHDWVVTTSFYAALHFVQAKIFPFTENSTTFNSVDEYVEYKNKISGRSISKHKATINLVKQQLPSIAKEYKRMHDTCMTVRYFHYKVKKEYADDAWSGLLQVEQGSI